MSSTCRSVWAALLQFRSACRSRLAHIGPFRGDSNFPVVGFKVWRSSQRVLYSHSRSLRCSQIGKLAVGFNQLTTRSVAIGFASVGNKRGLILRVCLGIEAGNFELQCSGLLWTNCRHHH